MHFACHKPSLMATEKVQFWVEEKLILLGDVCVSVITSLSLILVKFLFLIRCGLIAIKED